MTAFVTHVAKLVEDHLKTEGSGHDWQHIQRVRTTALNLAASETAANQPVDAELVELAVLLHDVDDIKLTQDPTSEEKLPTVRRYLQKAGVLAESIERVCATIKSTGYGKSLAGIRPTTLEGQLLSDADMLDAMGTLGIARTFAYNGHKGNAIFLPEILPLENPTKEQYTASRSAAINHFFEKLLRLRTMIYTPAGKAEAAIRHQRMVTFLENFFAETAAPAAWLELLEPYR